MHGKQRVDVVLQPVSGKALPVYRGEVLRIMQEEGGQCIDFNCFNLHDYKEHMSVGAMRRQGFRIGKGDFVISDNPRCSLMMAIQEMSQTCVTDLLANHCSGDFYEAAWGFAVHTNCQDTLAEAIGEYGLTPDDTHDSFNMFMNSGWTDNGKIYLDRRNPAKKGDFIDLLALMDVLAVPVICGQDVAYVSNMFLRPMRVQVFESSAETERLAQEYLRRYAGLRNQRTIESFRVKDIKTERELKPTAGYKPQFVNFPIKIQEIEIELTDEDYRQIKCLKMRGFAEDDEDAVRSVIFSWFARHRTGHSPYTLKLG
ncbi:MAG: urea carboxylase-associated family protein [Planctomycetes bacterium]|nr:urea carboxylase-associated family protein [Planctomycetota bacterium]